MIALGGIAVQIATIGAPALIGGALTYLARRAGWAWLRIAKVALPVLVGALAVALGWWAWSVYDRTRLERDVAVADVMEIRRTITEATVPPDKAGNRPLLSVADAKAALTGVVRDRDDARAN